MNHRLESLLLILAIILSLCGGPATEQANKSGGTLATTQSTHDSAERSHIVVKDKHHRCRALLLASYAIVRSGSNGKQGATLAQALLSKYPVKAS